MNVDFSKRVCDATLGEFMAAERTVGIVSGWVVAVVMVVLGLVARRVWGHFKAWKYQRDTARLRRTWEENSHKD